MKKKAPAKRKGPKKFEYEPVKNPSLEYVDPELVTPKVDLVITLVSPICKEHGMFRKTS